ncbi:MAG: hypothetical protein L3J19_09100 [Sulfurimonas sp.]|nr:hypothetical protein [Sulfurimonas sp.]
MFKLIITTVALTALLYANNYEKGDEAYEAGDIKKAISFWKKGVKNGEVESEFMLGFLYLRGDDITPNSKKSAALLARTFNHYDETLLITIAISYYKNMGNSVEDKLAIQQFEDAIDREGKVAQYNLGMLFVTGSGIKKDLKKGASLIKKSKKSNFSKATKAWAKHGLSKY